MPKIKIGNFLEKIYTEKKEFTFFWRKKKLRQPNWLEENWMVNAGDVDDNDANDANEHDDDDVDDDEKFERQIQ